jgi:CelD/BcsL family acetyltransferase involved in cellulose biosynthesis
MQLNIHANLSTDALDRSPVAERIGPFLDRSFLSATAHFTSRTVEIVESDDGALVIEREDGAIRLAGHEDLTDYHSPLGDGVADLIAALARSLPSGTHLDFDSLPDEAAAPIHEGLHRAGITAEFQQHEVTAILELPTTFDDYLSGLSKKQRHEVRRKIRRFTEILGAPRLIRQAGPDVIDVFADMHRRASGEKGTFMTDAMADHFTTLEKEADAVMDVLYGDDERPVAAAFGFEDAETTYLYNSAYEPELSDASPGVVLVASLIADTIERGHTRFDFLKGDEIYKFRMGAHERPLYRLTATT